MAKPARGLLMVALTIFVFAMLPLSANQEDTKSATAGKFDALIKDKKYLSAATLISNDRTLLDDSSLVRKYVDLLTDYYVITIGGRVFAMKDLEPGENIEDIRGKQGGYTMISGDVEKLVADKMKAQPESPEIQFAVGKYIAFRKTCCGDDWRDSPFKDPDKQEYDSFKFACDHKVFTWWSLFRMGVHELGSSGDSLDLAINHFKEAYSLNPDHLDTSYNLAVAYMMNKRYQESLVCVDRVVGRYVNPNLNADSYHLKGRVLYALGQKAEAASLYEKALEIVSWHGGAFWELLGLYREAGEKDKYFDLVLKSAARDYRNTLFLNYYVNFLSKNGVRPLDDELEEKLATLPLKTDEEVGAINFNLAKISLLKGDKKMAKERFQRALEALEKLKSPPPNAIEAIRSALRQL